VFNFGRLWQVVIGLPSDPAERRFAAAVILAFIPAAVLGAIFHDFIKSVLFSPWVVVVSLVVGGIAILLIERYAPRPRHFDAMRYPLRTSLGIGVFQCLAIIPGMSRSGSTIFGALLLRCDKRSAAEFSFFLAIPTMVGAFALDLVKQRHEIAQTHFWGPIAIGFVVSFVVGLVVVKTFIGFIGRYGLSLFVWWRILVGVAGLFALARGW
jgi:undecaprenyl-diphosphatase